MQRFAPTLALGTWLAARGGHAVVGLALSAVGVVASTVAACVLRESTTGGTTALIALTSSAIAWSAGMMLAFLSGMRAIFRDQEDGVLALVRIRGVSAMQYARGRAGGLALLLAAVVGGATLVASLAIALVTGLTASNLPAIAGALAYALAFSVTMGPLAIATLGGRTRTGGYACLVLVLFVPELLSSWTVAVLPTGWSELASIPAALSAARAGVSSPLANAAPLLRALAVLASIVAISLIVIAARIRRARDERLP
jgi:hypothetical protein